MGNENTQNYKVLFSTATFFVNVTLIITHVTLICNHKVAIIQETATIRYFMCLEFRYTNQTRKNFFQTSEDHHFTANG